MWTRYAQLLACLLVAAGCGHRGVAVFEEHQPDDTATTPIPTSKEDVDVAADAEVTVADRWWPDCSLAPGVHGEGRLLLDVDAVDATLTTESRRFTLTQEIAPRPGTWLAVYGEPRGTQATVPGRIVFPAGASDAAADDWMLHVDVAWCGEIECRFELDVSSFEEPFKSLDGWLAFKGDDTLENLEQVAVCLTASDGERSLTINMLGARPER